MAEGESVVRGMCMRCSLLRPIGNRVSSTDYDETGAARTSTYTANALNQYTSRTVPGWASVRGLANADATVAVLPAREGEVVQSGRPTI